MKDWDTVLPSTDLIRVLTIQGEWPREGTASSISGWVFTKLRISSGRALDALYCMPGAAQHPGLREDEEMPGPHSEAPIHWFEWLPTLKVP